MRRSHFLSVSSACRPSLCLLALFLFSFVQTATPIPDGQTQINTTATDPLGS